MTVSIHSTLMYGKYFLGNIELFQINCLSIFLLLKNCKSQIFALKYDLIANIHFRYVCRLKLHWLAYLRANFISKCSFWSALNSIFVKQLDFRWIMLKLIWWIYGYCFSNKHPLINHMQSSFYMKSISFYKKFKMSS